MRQQLYSIIQKSLRKDVERKSTMKSGEYNDIEKSVFEAFDKASEIMDVTDKQALLGMMTKHTVSIVDLINSGAQHPMSVWHEKITDHIIYLELLWGLVMRENFTEEWLEEMVANNGNE